MLGRKDCLWKSIFSLCILKINLLLFSFPSLYVLWYFDCYPHFLSFAKHEFVAFLVSLFLFISFPSLSLLYHYDCYQLIYCIQFLPTVLQPPEYCKISSKLLVCGAMWCNGVTLYNSQTGSSSGVTRVVNTAKTSYFYLINNS